MDELIVIRTHYYCEATERFYNYLKTTSNRDVAFICDESGGIVDVGSGKVKISLSEDSARDMSLYAPPKFGWLCGDYSLYAASKLLSGYDRYWLIEGDVRLSMPSSATFFNSFNGSSADLFAFHTFKANENWYWHSPMKYFAPDVYACLFPVVGISKRAVEFAYQARVKMSQEFENIVPSTEKRRWPNDESFLMTTLIANGFTKHEFKTEKFSDQTSFNVGLPKSDRRLAEQDPTGLLYHPVQSGTRFVSKANTWLHIHAEKKSSKEKLAALFGPAFLEDLRLESSDQTVTDFVRRLNTVIEKAPA